ncbi:MAG: DUF975 family protein [Lachnospiraceae bacterium]
MWTRRELKQQAKEALQRNYWKSVLVAFLLLVLSGNWIGGITDSMSDSVSDAGAAMTKEGIYFIAEGHMLEFDGGDTMTKEEPYFDEEEASQMEVWDETGQDPGEENIITNVIIAAVLFFVVLFLVLLVMAVIIALETFLVFPVIVGANRFMLRGLEGKAEVKEVAYAFDHSYRNVVKVIFHTQMSIFLWSLLFVIPGIYKKYQYRMVEFILAEHPRVPYKEAQQRSKDMMNGEKWNAFVLDLSFLLWEVVSVMTCGIAHVFYVAPYQYLTNAALYHRLCGMWEERTK